MHKFIFILCLIVNIIWSLPLHAQTFALTTGDVVGNLGVVITKQGDTLAQIARDHDIGFVEMEDANSGLGDDDKLPVGTVLVIPSQFILPDAPRRGIVVNLAEMRLYYYPKNGQQVITHPIGIGREGEDTPVGVLSIIQHIANPTWHVPDSIRKMRAAQGVYLPKSVPPGPDNPLGNYAMRLSKTTYLIHGTNEPLGGIGRRSSSGCLRMYPEDIKTLFYQTSNGDPVNIVNTSYKVGWSASTGKLYLESHFPLTGVKDKNAQTILVREVVNKALKNHPTTVNWDKVNEITAEGQGFPQSIAE